MAQVDGVVRCGISSAGSVLMMIHHREHEDQEGARIGHSPNHDLRLGQGVNFPQHVKGPPCRSKNVPAPNRSPATASSNASARVALAKSGNAKPPAVSSRPSN